MKHFIYLGLIFIVLSCSTSNDNKRWEKKVHNMVEKWYGKRMILPIKNKVVYGEKL